MEAHRDPGVPLAAPPLTARPSAAPIAPMRMLAASSRGSQPAPGRPEPVASAMPTYATHGTYHPQSAHDIAAAKAEYEKKIRRRSRRRRKIYGLMFVVLVGAVAAGWYGFREYIYGDDPTPAIVDDR